MKDLLTHNYIWEVIRQQDTKPLHLPLSLIINVNFPTSVSNYQRMSINKESKSHMLIIRTCEISA